MRKSLILIFFAFCLVSLGFRFYIYDKANLKPENGSKVAFKTRVLSEVKANSRIQSFSLSFKGYRIYVNRNISILSAARGGESFAGYSLWCTRVFFSPVL